TNQVSPRMGIDPRIEYPTSPRSQIRSRYRRPARRISQHHRIEAQGDQLTTQSVVSAQSSRFKTCPRPDRGFKVPPDPFPRTTGFLALLVVISNECERSCPVVRWHASVGVAC